MLLFLLLRLVLLLIHFRCSFLFLCVCLRALLLARSGWLVIFKQGASVPFQCVEGAARFGCSADEYGWELVDDSTCGECCDVRTCP